MPLLDVVILAAVQGLAEALPISRSGHGAAARLWLDGGVRSASIEPAVHVAIAIAFAFAARHRLAAILSDGVRAVARPALFRISPGAHDAAVLVVASAASLAVGQLVLPHVELWGDAALPTGIGLLVTGTMLASTLVARRMRGNAASTSPSLVTAALAGAAHGFAVFPGASRVGAALTVLLWLGVHPARAADLALLLTIPSLLVAFAHGVGAAGSIDHGVVATGLLFAFLAAVAASAAARSLAVRHRLGVLALWIIPLGLAMLAYARALRPPGA